MTIVSQVTALAGQTENAIQLLRSGFACPTKAVSLGNGEAAHSIYKFTGNHHMFSVLEEVVSYTRSDKRQSTSVQNNAHFADLEAVLSGGSSVKIVCHDGTDCIRQIVDEAGHHVVQNVTRIDFDLCDHDTADNVTTAIQTLIVTNR
jgi:hypothetical protein